VRGNLVLATRRARVVRDYLVLRGVARERIDAVGRGEAEPQVAELSRKALAKNRRVLLRIVELKADLAAQAGPVAPYAGGGDPVEEEAALRASAPRRATVATSSGGRMGLDRQQRTPASASSRSSTPSR